MKEKFTKGEWVVDELGDVILKGSNGGVGYPATEGTIASLNDGEYIENTNKFDAHLIAAAPEMYEMLKFLSEMNGYERTAYMENSSDVIDLLAKARGED